MYIAMNRFQVIKGCEDEFEQVWKNRQSRLAELSGFIQFQLLRCDTQESSEITLISSLVLWKSKGDFIQWTKSEQFKDAHKNASERKNLFTGLPEFEGFEVVVSS
ncbi:antibiotic biosynthesis monooxygenase family protein [Bartonella tamiae]|uniref:ABM domain-containing protein n=1 Tax=Bartonella tamiae Th239 TaxID=1094558 RepID=J1JZQ3_9HYPH|nr:antibiotic biosynthesis monooxygenase [Bartonella tamiae]EJF90617.1 hypothetical protein ME5_01018 [Bartonella tamiae Th239]EJF94006.1 hypothetical protein MEG_00864 [Bartonella tamiae Th307]